jgi:hypothetical protein
VRMKLALGLCAVSLFSMVAACDSNQCTLIGCGPALTLTIQGADDEPLPESTYEIVVVLDGEPNVVTCGHAPEAGGWFCEDPEGMPTFDLFAYVESGPARIVIEIQGSDGGDVVGPRNVDVDVMAGDATLAIETLSPQYEASEPNGEGCGRCEHADVDPIEIPIPM